MNCKEIRLLLAQGVQPGASDSARATLGFHLAGCPDCRAYRARAQEQQLLQSLLTQVPPVATETVIARRSTSQPVARRRMAHGLRTVSAAALVGMLAFTSVGNAAAAAQPAPAATPAYTLPDVLRGPAPAAVPTAFNYAELGTPHADVLRSSVAPVAAAGLSKGAISVALATDAPPPPAPPEVPAVAVGTILFIPVVPEAPAQVTAARADAVRMRVPRAQITPGTTYIVQPGDNLSAIALRAYGNAALWPQIYEANVGIIGNNPNLIFPGQQLTIPVLDREQRAGQPTQPNFTQYTVRPGDTLSAIALAAYGNAGYWSAIYNANRSIISNPDLIYPNQVLSIPAVTGVPGGDQTGGGPGLYTVRAGDTLSGIALFAYGNAALWPQIYEANRGSIANPSLIYPGQVLTIPR